MLIVWMLTCLYLLRPFTTRQVHGITMHSRKESPSHRWFPAPPPRPQQAPHCLTVGSGDRLGSPLPPAAAAQAGGSYPNAAALEQPSAGPAAPSVEKMVCARLREAGLGEESCRIPPWARATYILWLSCWQSCWAPCSWRPSSRSRVPGGQGWKVIYTSLASCLPETWFRRIWWITTWRAFTAHEETLESFELTEINLKDTVETESLLLKEILSDGTEDLIEMHDCYRQTWFQLFWIQNLKTPMSFCLNMLEIWIQTILVAKWL